MDALDPLAPSPPPPPPSAREVLARHREPLPLWLYDYQPGTIHLRKNVHMFLRSRIALYPGSGVIDGELFEVFAASHAVHGILHVDLMNDSQRVADILSGHYRPYVHVAGYRPIDLQVLDADATWTLLRLTDGPFERDPELKGACWAMLERMPEYTDAHGPTRLGFLHVQCEAVWLYWKLWVETVRHAPYGILLQDHGYGGNWTSFGRDGALYTLARKSEVLPRWLLSETHTAWPEFRRCSAPTAPRSLRLPPALGHGDSAGYPGRALYRDCRPPGLVRLSRYRDRPPGGPGTEGAVA